ncbi:MAG TPA: SDR family oxidoreductase [Steroidobacteraceae bacterium]|nr:SDR family oxidoreductase [Steroidobacteraceae bacterium]
MRNVIVTGGSRGLGLAIGATLSSAAYRVIAVARSETAEFRAAAELAAREGRGPLHFHSFDLAEIQGIGSLVHTLRETYGPLYGLVNNAGIAAHGLLTMMRDEDIEGVVQLNSLAPLVLTKYVLRSMMVERSGRIINMASIVASTGASGLAVYAATKASLIGFTRSLAREAGPLGITVNAIAPGFLDTDMTREMSEEDRSRMERRAALRRFARTEEVAAAVDYLLSEKARNITGTVLTIDAGTTA